MTMNNMRKSLSQLDNARQGKETYVHSLPRQMLPKTMSEDERAGLSAQANTTAWNYAKIP
jgi:hypothetical protein